MDPGSQPSLQGRGRSAALMRQGWSESGQESVCDVQVDTSSSALDLWSSASLVGQVGENIKILILTRGSEREGILKRKTFLSPLHLLVQTLAPHLRSHSE